MRLQGITLAKKIWESNALRAKGASDIRDFKLPLSAPAHSTAATRLGDDDRDAYSKQNDGNQHVWGADENEGRHGWKMYHHWNRAHHTASSV